VVEHLPGKCEALGSNHQKKKEKEEKKITEPMILGS
jgi:hypothetical protein